MFTNAEREYMYTNYLSMTIINNKNRLLVEKVR